MIIAYSKLGRSWNLDPRKASTVGGDLDCIRLLMRLAWEHPEHTFLLVGRNSGEDPTRVGYPANVVNPWTRWRSPTITYPAIQKGGKPYVDGVVQAFRDQSWRSIRGNFGEDIDPMDIDGHVMWLGQHGGSNTPIPQIGATWEAGPLTTPQMAFVNYCAYLLDYCWGTYVEPVLLCPDPRNYLKAREMPTIRGPVLAQYNMTKTTKHEMYDRWDDDVRPARQPHLPGVREGTVWVSELPYEYAAVEMTALDDPPSIDTAEEPGPIPVGVISNENRKEVGRLARLPLVREWLLKSFPDAPLYGKWSAESEAVIGRGPIPSVDTSQMYDTLRSFRCSITFPASGSGWATAKPWEAFAAGTVMFFHPEYDTQGHILPLPNKPHWTDDTSLSGTVRYLADYLRVKTPSEFSEKANNLSLRHWREVVILQREYFERAFDHWRGGARAVEEALDL